MKKLLPLFFLFVSAAVQAQVTNEKLVGTWKVISVEIEGIKVKDVDDQEEWKELMFTIDKKKDPEKVFTEEDSSNIAMGAAMMQLLVKKMDVFFRQNGKYGRMVDKTRAGQGIIEKEFGTWQLKKDKLTVKEPGEKTQSCTVSMPDNNTLILIGFVQKQMTLTFERQ